jgi:aminocarboxymuconate-semialdehyde decarboxylase
VTELGFVGGHVASNVNGRHLHDDWFAPVHRAAVDLNVPLFVHPADPAGKERMTDFELTIVAGYLFDNTLNLLKMVCSGFLERWPALKLVFAHTGAFGLLLRNRMQREVDTNAVLSQTLPRPVGDYMRQLYFDTVCFEPAILRFAASIVPIEHLMMGSDAPFPLGEPAPVAFVREALNAADAEQVLCKNFDRLIAS